MKARLVLTIALGALLVALPAVALGDSAGRASNTTTFADSTGEDAAAPDITSVVVSNDDAGNITFQINISNRPALTSDMYALIFVNSDQNPSTGSTALLGSDYVIQLEPGGVAMFQWNGSDFVAADSQTSLTYTYTPAGATIRVSATELGKTKGFKFVTIVGSGVTFGAAGEPDFTNTHDDLAPDVGHGFYTYQVLTKLILTATAFSTSPKPAKAGRPFSASLAAKQNDTGAPVQAGTVTCRATIAFKSIVAVSHVLTNGIANCIWRLPKTAVGKTLRGTITLTVQGVPITRSFSSRIS